MGAGIESLELNIARLSREWGISAAQTSQLIHLVLWGRNEDAGDDILPPHLNGRNIREHISNAIRALLPCTTEIAHKVFDYSTLDKRLPSHVDIWIRPPAAAMAQMLSDPSIM